MYYVYRFFDNANQIVYVGKTGHLKKRMTEHFSRQGHLTEEQYKQVKKIEYTELKFQLDMDFLEKYLIDLWKPSFNNLDKDSAITLFSFNNVLLKWKNFDKNKVIKPRQPVIISLEERVEKPKTNHYLAEEIRISNKLVNILNQLDLTLNEHKLLNAMFAQISPEDLDFKLSKISSSKIKILYHSVTFNHFKRDIPNVIYNLLNKNIFIKENNQLKKFPLMKILKYENNSLFFQFDDNLKPFLLSLKENFIQKEIKEIQLYNNIYALRFDLIFTMEFNRQTSKMTQEKTLNHQIRKNISIDKLREMFFCSTKYVENRDFMKYIIVPAIKEINDIGFYNVVMEKTTDVKNKITDITFLVSLGERNEKKLKIQSMNAKIERILLSSDFSKTEIIKILKNYEEKEIVDVLKTIKEKRKNNEIINDKEEINKLLNKITKEKELDALYNSL